MQWFNDSNDLIGLFLIVILIILVAVNLWLRSRYLHKVELLTQQHQSDLQTQYQKIQQLKNELEQSHKELEALDLERDKSEFEARKSYGQLMAANERLVFLETLQKDIRDLQQQHETLRSTNHELSAMMREQSARHEEEKRSSQEKLELLEKAENRLKVEFESLANQLFDTKVKSVDEQNKQSLDSLLSPLKEQLSGFKKQVSDNFHSEAKERHTLVHEIKQLQKLNEQMAQDAVNLTQALKGDNKQQGNWGEVVLAKVLQDSRIT